MTKTENFQAQLEKLTALEISKVTEWHGRTFYTLGEPPILEVSTYEAPDGTICVWSVTVKEELTAALMNLRSV